MNEDKILALENLINTPGWKIIEEELMGDVAITESKLFGEVPLSENETIDQLQRERIDRLELINLPENLIKEMKEEDEVDTDIDPEVY